MISHQKAVKRPRKREQSPPKTHIKIKICTALKAQLKKAAKKKGLSVSSFVSLHFSEILSERGAL